MPNWRKVITSGSNASLSSLFVTNVTASIVSASQFTGSLFGTASWATNAITSSRPIAVTGSTLYSTSPLSTNSPPTTGSIFLGTNAGKNATNAIRSNFFGNGAGNGATNAQNSNFFGSNTGEGATGAQNSNFFGTYAGAGATSAGSSNFFGTYAGFSASVAQDSNFFGNSAGNGATNANSSNFFGQGAGNIAINANYSNFFGYNAGFSATNADASNFFGLAAGDNATNADASNFFGAGAGAVATDANNSNFFGYQAGGSATNANYSNFFGQNAGLYATNANRSNFIGELAGNRASTGSYSNLIGFQSGKARAYLAENPSEYEDITTITDFSYDGYGGGFLLISATTQSIIVQGDYSGNTQPFTCSFFTITGPSYTINLDLNYYSAPIITSITYDSNFDESTFNFSPDLLQQYHNIITEYASIGTNNIIIGTSVTLEDGRQDSINIGGIIFGTGSYYNNDNTINSFSGSANGRIGINVVNPTYNFEVSGNVAFPNLTTGSATNVVMQGANGQLFITASSAFGGGSGVTINGNVDNRIVTATGTANTLDGEANLTFNGSTLSVTGNVTATSFTGSFSGSVFGYVPNSATSSFVTNSQTGSFVLNSQTSSFVLNSQTASFATTGSNTFIGNQTITGSLNASGSTHTITGSLRATSFTGSLQGTASWAQNVSAAGSNTQIQYNNNGALAGSPVLLYDGINPYIRVQSSNQYPLRVNSPATYELYIGGAVQSDDDVGIYGVNDEAIASYDLLTGVYYYSNGTYTFNSSEHAFLNDVRLTDNLIVSGNVILGNTSTDSITMNAATMSLGSGTGILNIDSNTLFVDGNNNRVGIGTSTPSSRLDVSGSVVVSGSLIFNPGTSPSFNGEIVRFGSGTLTRGQLYFLSSSGTWSLANANSVSSSAGMLGLAVGSSPTTDGLLIRGFAVSSSYTYGTGSIVYAATSSGLMTATSPSTTNHVVRVLGYQTTLANTIYFDPDKTWVTMA